MEAIRYIVDTLLWLLTLAFVLRLLFQLVRADFRDPMADAIVRVTNWLIMPLRRVLPPIGKIDTATVVAVLAVAAVRPAATLRCPATAFERLARCSCASRPSIWSTWCCGSTCSPCCSTADELRRAGRLRPGVRLLAQLCEPVLRPVRRIIPPIGQIDFSVLWVSIAIGALLKLLR
jgi:YggT family protein